jgi:O-antigen/teichoic acid export membrane protein
MQDVQAQSQQPMLARLFVLIAARLLSPLASFVIIVLIARAWGESNLGQYMTVLAWLAIFKSLSVFGLSEYISSEVGKDPSGGAKFLTHGLIIAMLFSLVCIGLMAGGAVLFRYDEEVRRGIFVASLALPSTACIMICQGVFTSFQKIKYIAHASLLESFLIVLLGSAVIIKGYGLIPLIYCIVIARLLALAFNLLLIHLFIVRLSFQVDAAFFPVLIAPAVIFGLTGICHQAFLYSDVIMLSKMKDMITLGLYSSASKLTEICLMLPMGFYVLNLPVASRFYKNFPESVQHTIEKYTKELFILVFLIFGFGTFFAEPILSLLYGRSFTEAAWVLRILMFAFLIQSSEMVLGMSCQAAGYHKAALYIVTFRTVLNISLNFILIPLLGMLGAALASVGSISLSFAMFHNFVKNNLCGFRWVRMIRKPALVCLLMKILLFPLSNWLNSFILGFLFLFGYAFFIFALNGFSLERVKSL